MNRESLLISAILNNGDQNLAKHHGILPEHFFGYRSEYEWILSYAAQFGRAPAEQEFLTVFPTFPHNSSQFDALWPATETYREWAKRSLKQKLTEAAGHIAKDDVEQAYEKFQGLKLHTTAEKPKSALRDPAFLDDYEAPAEVRVPVPWKTLQEATNGIGPGELWYFAARQSHGKSSMLTDMACSAVMSGLTVCVYSLEMTKRQIQVRAQAILGTKLGHDVNASKMLHRTYDHNKYKELLQDLESQVPGELYVHESSMGRVTPARIDARAKEYDLIIVDYAGLMYSDQGEPAIRDHRVMAEISNNLKEIALANNARILAAAQVNRDGDNPGPHPPRLKNLAQSDHLGNDGDVVITMKRYSTGVTINSIEKNRHGETGRYFTLFNPNKGLFHEISHEQAQLIKNEEDVDE